MKDNMIKQLYTLAAMMVLCGIAGADEGKKVFETYCWGCHHQSAVAFGPPFTQYAAF